MSISKHKASHKEANIHNKQPAQFDDVEKKSRGQDI